MFFKAYKKTNGKTGKRLFVGAYCRKNLGDDMFLQTLARRYPEHLFYIPAAPKYAGAFACEANVVTVPEYQYMLYRLFNKIYPAAVAEQRKKMICRADGFVKIGGSVFIEYDGWQRSVASVLNPHFFIIGANFGPFVTEDFFLQKREYIMKSEDCCFRDLYSYRLFENCKNVRYAPDVIFSYPDLPQKTDGENIGISVIDLNGHDKSGRCKDIYEDGLVKICNYWTQMGKNVKLFCFCEPEGDKTAAQRILEKCDRKERLQIVSYTGDTVGFLNEYNQCGLVYATRFHSMILGFVLNKRVVPVIYSQKQKNVLEDMNFSGVYWDVLNGEHYSDKFIKNPDFCFNQEIMNEFIKESAKQFLELDRFLQDTDIN